MSPTHNKQHAEDEADSDKEEVKPQLEPQQQCWKPADDFLSSLDSTDRDTISISSSATSSSESFSVGEANRASSSLRPEFLQKKRDFEYLMDHVTKMILDYYDACGRPTETKMYSQFLSPAELQEQLQIQSLYDKFDPANTTAQQERNDLCLHDIQTVFQYSLKTMHPFFLDKLYFGSDPIGQIAYCRTNTHW